MSDSDKNSEENSKKKTDELKKELGKTDETMEKMEKIIEKQEKITSTLRYQKSEGTTLVLSIVLGLFGLMGIGHIYVGRVKRGVAILIVGLLIWGIVFVPIAMLSTMVDSQGLSDTEMVGKIFGPMIGALVIGSIGGFALFIWQIINARSLCRDYNLYYEKKGQAPW